MTSRERKLIARQNYTDRYRAVIEADTALDTDDADTGAVVVRRTPRPLSTDPEARNRQLWATARWHREHPPWQELTVWSRIRDRQLGVEFRHQHVIYGSIVDFWCPDLRLAVEIDGRDHNPLEDHNRDLRLSKYEIRVLRIPAGVVSKKKGVEAAITRLRDVLSTRDRPRTARRIG